MLLQMQRHWRTHHLVDLFWAIERGHLPLSIPGNWDVEGYWADDRVHYELDHNWPYGITDLEEWQWNAKEKSIFKIETGIEPPRSSKGVEASKRTIEITETLKVLGVGQSFAVECADKKDCQKVGVCVAVVNKKNFKFNITTRTMIPKDGEKWALRVWRLDDVPNSTIK